MKFLNREHCMYINATPMENCRKNVIYSKKKRLRACWFYTSYITAALQENNGERPEGN